MRSAGPRGRTQERGRKKSEEGDRIPKSEKSKEGIEGPLSGVCGLY